MIKQLRVIISRDQIKGLVFILVGNIIIALIDALSVALMVPFMTILTDLDSFYKNNIGQLMVKIFHISTTKQALIILTCGFIILYSFRGICKTYFCFKQTRFIAKYRTNLSYELFKAVMNRPYEYHLKHNSAETIKLVGEDVNSCFDILDRIISCVAQILTGIGIVAVLFALDWKLTVTLMIIICIFLFFTKRVLGKINKRQADIYYPSEIAKNKWVNQTIGGLKNILTRKKQEYYVVRYREIASRVAETSSKHLALDRFPTILVDTCCMILVFSTVLIQLIVNENFGSTLPVFAAFAVAAMRLIPVVGYIASVINVFLFFRPSLDAVTTALENRELDVLGNDHIQTSDEIDLDQNRHKNTLEKGIELRSISFCYGDTDVPLYKDLNLFIPAKKATAFIGTTGSGKTTLADIILGLHKPTYGTILADDTDVSKNSSWWAEMIGYVPQYVYLADDTVRSNVAYGEYSDKIDDNKVWECLARAKIDDFVRSLPNGIDTCTGENGIRLSGGQRQRIGIARALYSNPQFLVMDEATSSLDGDTEQAIVDSINELSGDITLLIIAHRLSTIEKCHVIYRIENGEAKLERCK